MIIAMEKMLPSFELCKKVELFSPLLKFGTSFGWCTCISSNIACEMAARHPCIMYSEKYQKDSHRFGPCNKSDEAACLASHRWERLASQLPKKMLALWMIISDKLWIATMLRCFGEDHSPIDHYFGQARSVYRLRFKLLITSASPALRWRYLINGDAHERHI